MSLKDIMAAMKAQKANAALAPEPVVVAPEPVAVPPITSLNPPNGVPLGAPVIMGEFDKDRIKQGPFINGGEVQVSKLRKADLVEALRNQVSNLSAAQKVSIYTEHLDAEALTFEELKGDLKGTVGALRASLALILRVLAGNDDRLLRVYGVEALPKEVTEARKVAVKIDRSGKSKATQLAALLSEGKSADFVRDVNRNLVSPLSADLMQQVLALIPAEPAQPVLHGEPGIVEVSAASTANCLLVSDEVMQGVDVPAVEGETDFDLPNLPPFPTGEQECDPRSAITSPEGGVQFGFAGPDPVPGRTSEKPPLPPEVEQVIAEKTDAFVAQWEQLSGGPSFDKVEAVEPMVWTPEMLAFDARMSDSMAYMEGQKQGRKEGYEQGLEAGGKSAPRFLFISGQPRTSAIEVTYIDDFLRPIQERLEKKNGLPYGAVAYSEDFKQMATVLRDLLADNGLDEFPRYLVASNLRRDLPYILEALGSHYIVVN